jgi:hypothetical protein
MSEISIFVSYFTLFLYVWNKTLIGEKLRALMTNKLPEKLFYALGCPICLPFWSSVILAIAGILSFKYIAIVSLLTFVCYSFLLVFDNLND